MAKKKSNTAAGLLMYRTGKENKVELFLVHPGGPFFANKWDGFWSIPKGLLEPGEKALETAIREFEEETGLAPEADDYVDLGTIRQKSGKVVYGWAFEGDWPAGCSFKSNTFSVEWPPHSGENKSFPEVDQGQFFTLDEARHKINEKQIPFINRLLAHLKK
jgi:predicted NUDIX family NTP pyrophosphohydrolase